MGSLIQHVFSLQEYEANDGMNRENEVFFKGKRQESEMQSSSLGKCPEPEVQRSLIGDEPKARKVGGWNP